MHHHRSKWIYCMLGLGEIFIFNLNNYDPSTWISMKNLNLWLKVSLLGFCWKPGIIWSENSPCFGFKTNFNLIPLPLYSFFWRQLSNILSETIKGNWISRLFKNLPSLHCLHGSLQPHHIRCKHRDRDDQIYDKLICINCKSTAVLSLVPLFRYERQRSDQI